jgi:hypothetical protein
MPFYAQDNLTCWAYSVFTDEYESLDSDDKEQQKQMISIITAIEIAPLIHWVEDQIMGAHSCESDLLVSAMLNSIKWDVLRSLLKDWMEEENINAFDVDDVDAPNIYPYKKCSVCVERSSCGNYNDVKQWLCEDCLEPETPPTSESDQEDSKDAQGHSHLLETCLATLVISPA